MSDLVRFRQTFGEYALANKKSMQQAAASSVNLSRLYRIFVNCVATTPALQKCTPASVFRAMQQCSEIGLEPGGALGEAYLVPYKDQCQLIIGYRGLIELARRSGQLQTIEARCVFEGDEFAVNYGTSASIHHLPSFATADPRKISHVYSVAHLRNGATQFDVMPRAEVDMIRARSRSGQAGPWQTDYPEMGKKSVVRRFAKYLPLTVEAMRAVEIDTQNELLDVADSPLVEEVRDTPFDKSEYPTIDVESTPVSG